MNEFTLFDGKRCNGCLFWCSKSEFYKDRSAKDGLKTQCKKCHWEREKQHRIDDPNRLVQLKEAKLRRRDKALSRQREHYQENRERELAKDREAYWADPEKARQRIKDYRLTLSPEVKRQRSREAFRRNPERYRIYDRSRTPQKLEYQRRNRAENPDKFREKAREDRKNHPERYRRNDFQHYLRRRALKKGCSEHFTLQEWEQLCESFGNRCLRCGQEKILTVDHIVPLSKHGADTIDNIQCLCRNCNSWKRDKTIDFRPPCGVVT